MSVCVAKFKFYTNKFYKVVNEKSNKVSIFAFMDSIDGLATKHC